MGTDRRTPSIDRTALYTDLFGELRAHRSGVHQSEMAQALLRTDANGSRLVGLADDCERAVLYNTASRTLESVPFDEHGLAVGDATVLKRRLDDPASWVGAHGGRLDWVHPHYLRACGLSTAGQASRAATRRTARRTSLSPASESPQRR